MIIFISVIIMFMLYELGNKLFKEHVYNKRLKAVYMILCFIITCVLIRLSYLYY